MMGPNANFDKECLTEFCGNLINNTFFDINYTDVLTEDIAYTLNVYMTPAIVIIGIIGNVLSVIVFFKIKLRGQSTSQYLSALAISDTVFLLQLIPPWLMTVKACDVFTQNGLCQMFVYLTYVSSALSSWLVVAFTVERFVAVLYPLRRTRMCTLRRARILILLIIISCLVINIPVLIFTVPTWNDCNIAHDQMDHAARFNVVDTVFTFTLPLALITMLNVYIMRTVCKQGQARRRLVHQEGKSRRSGPSPRGRGRSARLASQTRRVESLQQRITRMLLIVSSFFVILNLPAYTMRIVAYANNMYSHEYGGRWAAIQQICLQFFNVNFGINFFLYCMTGQNFRRALCQTFPCLNRLSNIIRRVCCWWPGKPDPPPHPAPTSSFTIHTEASTAAASGLSLNVNIERVFSWRKCGAGGRCKQHDDGNYLELYRLDNSRQRQQQQLIQNELQLYPVQMYQFESGRPWRPVPRAPVNRLASPPTAPVSIRDPLRMFAMTTFRPIKYHLVPGQIAPLGVDPTPPTLSLNPSPTPPPSSTPPPSLPPSPHTLPPSQNGRGAFSPAFIRLCPYRYELLTPKHGDMPQARESFTLLPKESGLFLPVRGPVPLARCQSPPAGVRARSQSQPVRTRSLSPVTHSPRRRCATAPANF